MKVLKSGVAALEEYMTSKNIEMSKISSKLVRFAYGEHFEERFNSRFSSYRSVASALKADLSFFERGIVRAVTKDVLLKAESKFKKIVNTLQAEGYHNYKREVWFIFNNSESDEALAFSIPVMISRLYVSAAFQKSLSDLLRLGRKYSSLSEVDKKKADKLVDFLNHAWGEERDYDYYASLDLHKSVLYPRLSVVLMTFTTFYGSKESILNDKDKRSGLTGYIGTVDFSDIPLDDLIKFINDVNVRVAEAEEKKKNRVR